MPRPKVLPGDRQRAYRACLVCKTSKIRCDSELPCSPCIKRGRESSCVYSDVKRRRRLRAVSPPPSQSPPLPQRQQQNQPHFSAQPTLPASNVNRDITTGESTPNPMGGKGFNTETVSLPFLHFLQKSLKPYVGRLRFTDCKVADMLPEVEFQNVNPEHSACSPAQMYRLLDFYFEATSGLFDLFTADEIDILIEKRSRAIDTSRSPVTTPEDLAALDIALAIGSQLLPLGDPDGKFEEILFSRARQIAFYGMLEKPRLSMIRLFLLLAFYTLGANHRSAAAMYLGISTKAAVVVGLDNPRNCSPGDTDFRSRTWTSLRIFDLLASFIFGQSQNLRPSLQDTFQIGEMDDALAWQGKINFAAMSKGCSIVENVVQALRKGSILDGANAEELLSQLRNWIQSLPEAVRRFTFRETSTVGPEDRHELIGSVHVSCLYYFAVILVTRPFLIEYLISRLRGRAIDFLIDDSEELSDVRIKNIKISQLAHVCVSSAAYMAETLQRIKAAEFKFGNLCLIKSWVFGSGLVLGFSRFAGEPRPDIDSAFKECCDVLETIGESCNQARVYHEILISFAEAISTHREEISLETRRTVQHYIDRVLVVDNAEIPLNQNTTSQIEPPIDVPVPLSPEAEGLSAEDQDLQLSVMPEGFHIGLADLDRQSLDYLYFDMGDLLCSVE